MRSPHAPVSGKLPPLFGRGVTDPPRGRGRRHSPLVGVWGRQLPASRSVSKARQLVRPPALFFENYRSRTDKSGKRSIRKRRILKKRSRAEDLQKISTRLSNFLKKSPARLPDFSKIVWQQYRTFLNKLTKVTGLFKKYPPTLTVFLEKMWIQNTPFHT